LNGGGRINFKSAEAARYSSTHEDAALRYWLGSSGRMAPKIMDMKKAAR